MRDTSWAGPFLGRLVSTRLGLCGHGRPTAVDHAVQLLGFPAGSARGSVLLGCATRLPGVELFAHSGRSSRCLRRGRQIRNPDCRAVSLPTTVKQMFRKELKKFRKELFLAMVQTPWSASSHAVPPRTIRVRRESWEERYD